MTQTSLAAAATTGLNPDKKGKRIKNIRKTDS